MKPILYIKGRSEKDVRLQKFIKFFQSRNIEVNFWGWNRMKSHDNKDRTIKYLFSGGGAGNKILLLYYPLWMAILFLKVLFTKSLSKYTIIAINYECGFPLYLASRIKKINYIYEIYDEFAISHKFPSFLKNWLIKSDKKIMNKADFVIHVDKNRIRYKECKSIVIENTPYDYFEGEKRNYDGLSLTFAVTGMLSQTRGIEQIYKFASNNPCISFLVVGVFYDTKFKQQLLSLPNVSFHEKVPQNILFSMIKNCCGIFSLYSPCIEINKLAASNKVYDAMMLGIPVITNQEVINSKFIKDSEVGIVVDYNYNESWDVLCSENYLEKAKYIGQKGRKLYLDQFFFDTLVLKRLLPLL